jgi:2',3'-cyclic-nucleotide 2'-phosphodiesterase (5'-nucleotidase family)
MKLKILHTNDLHSRFEEFARIASAIEEQRDEKTLILDAGDNADFSRLETEGTNGRISSALLNRMGYTARVFGNNEGFAGKENTRITAETSDCPVITCNMYDLEGKKLGFLKDAITLNVSGIRILIIGVTAPLNVFYRLFGIEVKDPEQEVQRVLAEHENTSYDLTILVSHLGLTGEKNIASKFPNINVIIGGHSHTILDKPLVENRTIICQAGHFGEYLGELTLNLDDATKKIQDFSGRIIPSQRYPQHPEIVRLLKNLAEQADKNMSRELYSVNRSLNHSLTKENAIGNLLADA